MYCASQDQVEDIVRFENTDEGPNPEGGESRNANVQVFCSGSQIDALLETQVRPTGGT
jgi:hypothetical protein